MTGRGIMDNIENAKIYAMDILQQTPNGVAVVDRETRIRWVNPSFREMFQCCGEKIMNRSKSLSS